MNYQIEEEQHTMHFVLQTPPLQHLAAVKIVTTLCNQRDIFYQILQSHLYFNDYETKQFDEKEWQVIEEKVKTKVGTLIIPPSCKQQLVNIIKPIGIEIIDWCNYHFLWLDILLRNQLCWSMHGTVDYAKTVQLMLKDEGVDIKRRFELACINCLEDEARELFPRMDKYPCRPTARQEFDLPGRQMELDQQQLLHFFNCVLLKGHAYNGMHNFWYQTEDRGDVIITHREIRSSALSISRTMCEYWFEKLSQRDQNKVLEDRPMLRFRQARASSFLYFLSLMNEEQQERMFRMCARDVLVCLLRRWPMQSLFMEAAKCGWRFMNSQACSAVLFDIIRKMRGGSKDYDYSQLFWECWALSPAEHKQHFLGSIFKLEDLIATKQVEFVQLVLNEAPSHHLRELVEKRYDKISAVLTDESVISDAALTECKVKIGLNSSNEPPDEEKRLRNEYVSRLVDMVMESRIEKRKKCRSWIGNLDQCINTVV